MDMKSTYAFLWTSLTFAQGHKTPFKFEKVSWRGAYHNLLTRQSVSSLEQSWDMAGKMPKSKGPLSLLLTVLRGMSKARFGKHRKIRIIQKSGKIWRLLYYGLQRGDETSRESDTVTSTRKFFYTRAKVSSTLNLNMKLIGIANIKSIPIISSKQNFLSTRISASLTGSSNYWGVKLEFYSL